MDPEPHRRPKPAPPPTVAPPMKTIDDILRKNPKWGTSKKRKRPPLLRQQEILDYQSGKCERCGCSLDGREIEFDHVVPWSICPNNFVVATCRPCNQRKGGHVVVEGEDHA